MQVGTRFIATEECLAHADYKRAIVAASAEDIVLSERITGVPVAVIATPHVKRVGTKAGWLAKRMLAHPKGKHYARMYYSLKSIWQLKNASHRGSSYRDYFQAGRSVQGIHRVERVGDVVRRFAVAADELR